MKVFMIIIALIITVLGFPWVASKVLSTLWTTPYPILGYALFLFFLLLFAYGWTWLIVYVKTNKHPRKLIHCIYLCLIVISLLPFPLYQFYEYSLGEKMETEVDLSLYEPFKSELLANLDDDASYHMEDPVLKIDGATAFYPVYAAFVQAVYPEGKYPYWGEIVACNTTPIAYEFLAEKRTEMIFVFAPSSTQLKMFVDNNEELDMTPIGKESFVFFVNASNPVDSLTSQQIKDIYSGKITNWREVGGDDKEIKAFQRPEGSGSQTILLEMMEGQELMKPPVENVASGMGDIISETAAYRNADNAIGYSFRYYAQDMVGNRKIKLLKIDGVEPNEDTIKSGEYPLVYPFYAVSLKSNKNPRIKEFKDWMLSKQGKELIKKSGYIAWE